MKFTKLKLVTIIGEELLKEKLLHRVIELGATGASYHSNHGVGPRNARRDDVFGENFQLKVICPNEVAEKILSAVSKEFYDQYAIIAWQNDVEVLNGEDYLSK